MSVDDSKPEDSNDSQGPDEETKPKGKKERSPDLAKFWKAVEDDPQDFTGNCFFFISRKKNLISFVLFTYLYVCLFFFLQVGHIFCNLWTRLETLTMAEKLMMLFFTDTLIVMDIGKNMLIWKNVKV